MRLNPVSKTPLVSSGLNLPRVNAFLTLSIWGGILIPAMAVNHWSRTYQLSRRGE